MKNLLLITLFSLSYCLSAQSVWSNSDLAFPESSENIQVKKLSSDTNSTSFVIQIREKVRAHYHESHTETLYVYQGKASMQLGDTTYTIAKGDVIVISPGTVHSVEVLSSEPLKVLSVQAPEFLGKDRHFVNR